MFEETPGWTVDAASGAGARIAAITRGDQDIAAVGVPPRSRPPVDGIEKEVTAVTVADNTDKSTAEPQRPEESAVAVAARNSQLGSRLRDAREHTGISLREMARRVGVSPSFISQIELGRTAPSVGTLYAIVAELGVSLDALMAENPLTVNAISEHVNDHAPIAASHKLSPLPSTGNLPGLQRSSDRPELYMAGVRWERLTTDDDPRVEFLRITYPPGTESCPAKDLMTHGGTEYGHILEGSLELQVGFSRQVLGPGDSVNFESSTPHRLSNPFEDPCTAIWFVLGRRA